MSYVLNHSVPIHVTALADDVLDDDNKLQGGTKFNVTDTAVFEETKHLNSGGYSGQVPVWNTLTGSIDGDRITGDASQDVIFDAFKNRTAFYIHVLENPSASAGSKGLRYKAFAETHPREFEAGAKLKFSVPLKFDGAPVAI